MALSTEDRFDLDLLRAAVKDSPILHPSAKERLRKFIDRLDDDADLARNPERRPWKWSIQDRCHVLRNIDGKELHREPVRGEVKK